MPNYEEHKDAGEVRAIGFSIVVFCIALLLTSDPLSAVVIAIGGGVVVVLGSVFPDVDHHSAKPHKKLRTFVATTFIVATSYAYLRVTERLISEYSGDVFGAGVLAYQLGLGVIIVPFAGFVGYELVNDLRPKHRGITHTKPAGLVLGATIALGVWVAGNGLLSGIALTCLAVACGAGFYVGVLKHLRLDGLIGSERAEKVETYSSVILTPLLLPIQIIKRGAYSISKRVERRFWQAPLRTKILYIILGGLIVGIVYSFFAWMFSSDEDQAQPDTEREEENE